MSDEDFHEIQLNGKQLVFLFMAATVVSVVIFLCGVMVGRGVRDRTATAAAVEPVAGASAADASDPGDAGATRPQAEPAPTSGSAQPRGTAAPASPPPDQAPPPTAEDGDYYDSLVKERTDTKLATPVARAEPTPEKPPAAPAPKSPATAATAAPAADRGPTSSGYAVQLVAVRERGEADAIAKRLVSKGYQAYVLVPQPGKPPVYRVQVGRFKSRGDADKVASRLRKEEQFKPWVTR